MLKAAIEKILEIATPVIYQANGEEFVITKDGEIRQIRTELDTPDTLDLSSLDSLVKMVKSEASNAEEPLYITVPTHLKVICFGQPHADRRNLRQFYYEVKATDVPGWDAVTNLPFDQAAVALQTRFQDSVDREYAMQLLSQITTGAKVTYNDIGVATNVVTSKGVALQQNSTIRPLVKLRPYRTFQEVEQPEGLFLIRIDERGITFTEADGGMWKLEARKTIVNYLTERLHDLVEIGGVIIAL